MNCTDVIDNGTQNWMTLAYATVSLTPLFFLKMVKQHDFTFDLFVNSFFVSLMIDVYYKNVHKYYVI